MHRSTLSCLAALLALSGCGGAGTTDASGGTGAERATLTITDGGRATDTALAVLKPIVVSVKTAAGARAGIGVRFEVLPPSPTTQRIIVEPGVASVGTQSYASTLTVATDAQGSASAVVQLGSIVGDARIAVTCPELGVSDTARFHILPGETSQILLTARDTMLLAGQRFRILGVSADRSGNATNKAVTYTAGQNVLSVDDSGQVRTTRVEGRGVVQASTGAIRDSVRFRMVLGGRVLFLDYSNDAWGTLTSADLDGTNSRIHHGEFGLGFSYANLSPAGDELVYQSNTQTMIVGPDGIERALVDPLVLEFSTHPRFGWDGQSVYFSGRASNLPTAAIWRVQRDGSQLQRITTPTAQSGAHLMPTPSPDGARLAYMDANGLELLTLSTGSVSTLGSKFAQTPEFSPDGQWIAYRSRDTAYVAKIDGSRSIALATGLDLQERTSWLPNSSLLLVRSDNVALLIDIVTGERMPLPWLSPHRQIVSAP